jgi:hypothetical protein
MSGIFQGLTFFVIPFYFSDTEYKNVIRLIAQGNGKCIDKVDDTAIQILFNFQSVNQFCTFSQIERL